MTRHETRKEAYERQTGDDHGVDDTPGNLDLLREMLQRKGYRVQAFPRGAMALKAALTQPPDLILLDVMMPEKNGFEVNSNSARVIIFISDCISPSMGHMDRTRWHWANDPRVG